MDDEINDLQVMLVESKYCTERDDYLQKRWQAAASKQ